MWIALGLDSLDSPDRVSSFIASGVDEFFAGYIPPEWFERYGWEASLNRRAYGASGQFTDLQALADIIEAVHAGGAAISLAFNAHEYCQEQTPLIHAAVTAVEALAPDAYIVADPGLMLLLRQWGVKRALHLSTGAACFNADTVRFYCDRFPVRRVVIPRKMTVAEISGLVASLDDLDLEFEAMVVSYRCFFNDEFCFAWHSNCGDNLCGSFVAADSRLTRRFPDDWKKRLDRMIADPQAQLVADSELDKFRKIVALGLDDPGRSDVPAEESTAEGMSRALASMKYMNCGLCAIPALRAAGVDVLKVPTRGSPVQKDGLVRVVQSVLDEPNPTPEFCRALIDSPGFCSGVGTCYYALEDN